MCREYSKRTFDFYLLFGSAIVEKWWKKIPCDFSRVRFWIFQHHPVDLNPIQFRSAKEKIYTSEPFSSFLSFSLFDWLPNERRKEKSVFIATRTTKLKATGSEVIKIEKRCFRSACSGLGGGRTTEARSVSRPPSCRARLRGRRPLVPGIPSRYTYVSPSSSIPLST